MNLTRKKRLTSIVGLTLDNGRLEAALVTRTNGSIDVKKQASLGLSLDLMRNEPELVGHEIRNLLDQAGIRERRCVVGIPAEWFLSLHIALPEGLSNEDVAGLIELEAERGFPAGLDQLQTATSIYESASERHATQLAVPNDHIVHLESVLSAAQLRPQRLSLAVAALPRAIAPKDQGGITVLVGELGITLLVAAGGGIVSLRMLNNVFESEGNERRVLADVVAREIRITLAQLPHEVRNVIREIRVVGSGAVTEHLLQELQPRAERLGLTTHWHRDSDGTEQGLKVKGEHQLSGALSLAAQFLAESPDAMNFLPPKPTLWQQVSRRYSGKRLAYSGASAGAIAALVLALFLFQGFRLSALQRDWNAIESKVTELEAIQNDIRTFRSWVDPNITSLEILKRVTEAFPEEGSVTARTVEIQTESEVNITGVTRDNKALLEMLDRMRVINGIQNIKVDTIRGRTPMQFTFNFNWEDRP